ncbi:hypothetical protein OIU77_025382 [Salix suchowensis]|uniref:Uncharacterized protein n=1 Tax=Salix suchowensis TaxID=1278906 RepID=A0ABQ9BWW6_9ROSI|nr:hypothetical protein OIU77_025382 [Salix suchowensis]
MGGAIRFPWLRATGSTHSSCPGLIFRACRDPKMECIMADAYPNLHHPSFPCLFSARDPVLGSDRGFKRSGREKMGPPALIDMVNIAI